MKKITSILVMMAVTGTPLVFAQEVVNQTSPPAPIPVTMALPVSYDPLQVSVEGGGLWSEKDKTRLHDGEEITGRLTYDVTPNVALGAESGGIRFEDEIDGTKYGHLDGVPIMADLVLKMPIAATGNRLVPYIYGAAGAIVWSYEKSDYSDDTGVDARTRAHFAAKPGGGLEYYLTPHVSIFAEASYLFSRKYELRNGTTTPPNGKVNVDSLYGGGGIKLAF